MIQMGVRQDHYIDRRVVQSERIDVTAERHGIGAAIDDDPARPVLDVNRVTLTDVENTHHQLSTYGIRRVSGRRSFLQGGRGARENERERADQRESPYATICRSTARTGAASSAMSFKGNAISSYMLGVILRRSRFSRIAPFPANSM